MDFLGTSGTDTLNGAGGDDVLIFDATGRLVDGGTGSDTLQFKGSSQLLDLTAVANGKYTGIEVMDLTDKGNNTLTLAVGDLLDLSDSSNQLTVAGNSGDTVNAGSGWTQGSDLVIGPNTYHNYAQGLAALLLDIDIMQTILP